MNNESIKSPEEMIKPFTYKAGLINENTEVVMILDTKNLMQSYYDQNLTEYKRRLKEGIENVWVKDRDFNKGLYVKITDLIDSIDLNKK